MGLTVTGNHIMLHFYKKGKCVWDMTGLVFPAEVGKYKLHYTKYKVCFAASSVFSKD